MRRTIRRLTGIAALLFGALLPSAVEAATLYITEYSTIGSIGTLTTPWPPGNSVATQTVAVGGGSLQSAAFNAQTKAVLVTCDTGCSVLFGSNPTATTSTTLLQQGVPYEFVVAPGQKVAVIANAAGNIPGGGGGASDVNVSEWGGAATSLGQKAMAASVPVTIASDQSAVASNITTIAGNAVVTGGQNGLLAVGGNVASLGTDSGNPVKVGGVHGLNPPTLGAGQRGDLQLDSRGGLYTVIKDAAGSNGANVSNAAVDGLDPTTFGGVYTLGFGYTYNGTTWNRLRGTTEGVNTLEIPSATSAVAVTSVVSTAAESGHIIKASAGNLYGFSVTTGATAGLVMVFNSATVPGNGAVTPIKCYSVAANSTIGAQFTPPLAFSTGISIGFGTGTDCFTRTASATAFISGDAK